MEYGINIVSFEEALSKYAIGFQIGLEQWLLIYFDMECLRYVGVALRFQMKHLGILVTIILMYLLQGIKPSPKLIISSCIICGGAIYAGWGFVNDGMYGYSVMSFNTF